jgi:hypothetical protein
MAFFLSSRVLVKPPFRGKAPFFLPFWDFGIYTKNFRLPEYQNEKSASISPPPQAVLDETADFIVNPADLPLLTGEEAREFLDSNALTSGMQVLFSGRMLGCPAPGRQAVFTSSRNPWEAARPGA